MMKNLTLTFKERLQISDAVGAIRGTIAETRIPNRILDKIEPTEEEKKAANYHVLGPDRVEFDLVAADVAKTVDLEDAEAERLCAVMETWKGFAPRDNPWAERVVAALKKEA